MKQNSLRLPVSFIYFILLLFFQRSKFHLQYIHHLNSKLFLINYLFLSKRTNFIKFFHKKIFFKFICLSLHSLLSVRQTLRQKNTRNSLPTGKFTHATHLFLDRLVYIEQQSFPFPSNYNWWAYFWIFLKWVFIFASFSKWRLFYDVDIPKWIKKKNASFHGIFHERINGALQGIIVFHN